MHMAAQSFRNGTKFCAPSSGCESVMNAFISVFYREPARESLRSSLHGKLLQARWATRRDELHALHCQVWRRQSGCQFRLLQRPESQAQDLSGSWPADRCLDEEFCIFSPRFLTCSPAPLAPPISGEKNPDALGSGNREYPRKILRSGG